MSDENPLFAGFQPQAIGGPSVTPFTGEVIPPLEPGNKPPKKARKPRAKKGDVMMAPTPEGARPLKPVKAARKKVAKPRKPKPITLKEFAQTATIKAAPVPSLQTIFAAMREMKESDHPVFEKMLADHEMRGRVLLALSKLFP